MATSYRDRPRGSRAVARLSYGWSADQAPERPRRRSSDLRRVSPTNPVSPNGPPGRPTAGSSRLHSNRDGNFEIYVRRVEGGQDVNVTNNPADDVQPAFSPDGTSIAFVSTRSSRTGLIKIGTFIGFDTRTYGGDIWVTPALGGQARRLAEDGNFPVWNPNGRRGAVCDGPRSRSERSSRCRSMEAGRRRFCP